jgi:DNA-binding SARP family transcriptional activator
VLAALAAVECDPLRETSNALLVRAHLTGGDRVQAARVYQWFARLLDQELGVGPSPAMSSLLAEAGAASGGDRGVTLG